MFTLFTLKMNLCIFKKIFFNFIPAGFYEAINSSSEDFYLLDCLLDWSRIAASSIAFVSRLLLSLLQSVSFFRLGSQVTLPELLSLACIVLHLYFNIAPVEKCMYSVILIVTVLPAFCKFLEILRVNDFSKFFLIKLFFKHPVKPIWHKICPVNTASFLS